MTGQVDTSWCEVGLVPVYWLELPSQSDNHGRLRELIIMRLTDLGILI